MAMSNITVKGITPALAILGAYQRFVYEDNLSSFQLDNTFIPTNLIPSQTNSEMRNNTLSGFRWVHKTLSGETTGSLKLQSFVNASPTGTDIMLFGQDGSLTINAPLTMSANLNMNGFNINNVADPINPQDAVTKQYADAISMGLTFKNACYAATTMNNLNAAYLNGTMGVGATLTNSGSLSTFSVDGVSPPLNARIIVKNQTITFQNGIYKLTVVGDNVTPWVLTRATDFDQASEIAPGDFILIDNGTINTKTAWIQTATVNTIGTDPILFSEFGNFQMVTEVLGTAGQIDVINGTSTPVISIDPTYAGQTSITTLGTITTGTWNGSVIPVIYGGTGASTASTALANLGAVPLAGGTMTGSLILNANPTTALGAVTKDYVDSIVPSSSITLIGDISASGILGSPIVTTFIPNPTFLGNGYMSIPTGTTAQRPNTPAVGMIRYNTTFPTAPYLSDVTLTGAVFGSGIGTIDTRLSPVVIVNDGISQEFIFDSLHNSSLFQITNQFSPAGGTTAFSNFAIRTGNKDFYFQHVLPPAASTGNDNGTFSLYTHSHITDAASLIFSTSYSASLNLYTSAFSTNLGIGTLTPTQASLVVNGGIQNIVGEDSCIRAISSSLAAKIELQNTNVSGKTYELRSDNSGRFAIKDRTNNQERIRIDPNGNVIIINNPLNDNIGTPASASLEIRGGVRDVAVEDSCIRVIGGQVTKISLQATSGGRIYELRSLNLQTFEIVDRTSGLLRLMIDPSGNLIIPNLIYGRKSSALITMQNNAISASVIANNYTKVAGVYSFSGLTNDFTTAANGRITYNGLALYFGNISISVNVNVNVIAFGTIATTEKIFFAIAKNGVILPNSVMYSIGADSAATAKSISLGAIVPLAANDYLEIFYMTNTSNASPSLTAINLTWSMTAT